jgi:antitoxin component of MazEF toxin-antitoxin module
MVHTQGMADRLPGHVIEQVREMHGFEVTTDFVSNRMIIFRFTVGTGRLGKVKSSIKNYLFGTRNLGGIVRLESQLNNQDYVIRAVRAITKDESDKKKSDKKKSDKKKEID